MPARAESQEQSLIAKIRRLPPEKLREVENFVESLSQPSSPEPEALELAYREMAADETREREALEWCEAHVADGLDSLPEENPEDWRH
jgi:hypothetical protein